MLSFQFSPFPVLETNRLMLRQINFDDADAFFELRTNEKAMKFIGKNKPTHLSEIYDLMEIITKDINENLAISWAITLKGESRLIGTIGYYRNDFQNYRGEIGYMLLPVFWQKGIMSEAIQAVLHYGFEVIKFHSISANIDPRNKASAAILKKFNFIKEAYFRENYYFNGEFLDSEIYGLLNPSN
jgi:ribosomal-protein-alanine N-acetyltransferase